MSLNNITTDGLLDELDNSISALKMLSHLCAISQDKQLGNMFWLLQPIVDKQEEMLTSLWKNQAKK
jgi:hypothetical protein